MKNDKARTDNQVKAETVSSNNAKAEFQFNSIKQKVRLSNEKDSFWIDATANLPAIQNIESTRAEGSAVKPIEYSEKYLQWLVSQLIATEGIKKACELVLNKCYMIRFNHEIGVILKATYKKLMAEHPDMPVSKFDVEKLINEHPDVQYFNDKHSWPATEKADKLWNSCVKLVNEIAEAKGWSDDKERLEKGYHQMYNKKLAEQQSSADLLNNL